ncbi:hypothetical protein AR543_07070 [Paenibacillus bovis]|uniref:Uncharacterized protein n=1 Tax=Paenibacillus bovis TaxID=1616788 RepID=A0A172ZDU8_9BACL|nr:hypothetical protein AR543_07070 [Paenibacillus bovis]
MSNPVQNEQEKRAGSFKALISTVKNADYLDVQIEITVAPCIVVLLMDDEDAQPSDYNLTVE